MDYVVRFATEFVATFLLCVIAVLAMAGTGPGDAGRVNAALGYGLGVVAAMHACGAAGAVHLNPAVTLAVFTAGRGGVTQSLARIVGQLAGAGIAGVLLMWLLAGQGTGWGAPTGSLTRVDGLRTVVVEGLLTIVWSGAFLGSVCATKLGTAAPVAVALSVTAAALAGMPFTGGLMNPARALASAVASVDFSTFWMYAAGPIGGAAVGGLIGRLLLDDRGATTRRG